MNTSQNNTKIPLVVALTVLDFGMNLSANSLSIGMLVYSMILPL